MALSDARYTPAMLLAIAGDEGPEFSGKSRSALRWCAAVTEAADAAIQEAREVRKDDEALIRQMLEALEKIDATMPFPVGRHAITAARARLGEKP